MELYVAADCDGVAGVFRSPAQACAALEPYSRWGLKFAIFRCSNVRVPFSEQPGSPLPRTIEKDISLEAEDTTVAGAEDKAENEDKAEAEDEAGAEDKDEAEDEAGAEDEAEAEAEAEDESPLVAYAVPYFAKDGLAYLSCDRDDAERARRILEEAGLAPGGPVDCWACEVGTLVPAAVRRLHHSVQPFNRKEAEAAVKKFEEQMDFPRSRPEHSIIDHVIQEVKVSRSSSVEQAEPLSEEE